MEVRDMEESNTIEVEKPMEGINLQVIMEACQAQRQDTIPPDLL